MPSSVNAASVHSIGSEPVDLSTTPLSLARAVHARRSEYVRKHKTRVKIGTWNVGACPGTDKDLGAWFVEGKGLDTDLADLDLAKNEAIEHAGNGTDDDDPDSVRVVGGDSIGLYVLGLQEVIDLNTTKDLMGRAVYTDNRPTEKWKTAMEAAVPPGYQLVTCEQMVGLMLLVYASPEMASSVGNVSTKSVGTGLLGYFGNKGAVTTRLVLGESTRITFVNCHLASGASSNYLDRRCWDVGQVLSKTQFEPIVHSGVAEDDGEKIGDEDFAFWFGDLNFRIDGLPGDDIRRLLTLHAKGEYGIDNNESAPPPEGEGVIIPRESAETNNTHNTTPSTNSRDETNDQDTALPDPDDFPEDPSQDPTSLQATVDSLLPHDQLRRVIKQRKAFHDGWREGPVSFLPTYKYDIGTVGLFDSSEKRRAPSWCDRILYRTRQDKNNYGKQVVEEEKSKKRDAELKSRGVDENADEDILFSYDPSTDGDETSFGEYDEYDENDDNEPQLEDVVESQNGTSDNIQLDLYTSHQRITSSDHKPITSVFTLNYVAVVPKLKARIHAEVARELDRAENEGRPGITVIIDGAQSHDEGVIDFGDIGFLETKSCSITIANTSGVPASFYFVDRAAVEEDQDPSDGHRLDWLQKTFVRPEDGPETDPLGKRVTLEPGETVLALIDGRVSSIPHLQSLNDGTIRLDEILVLRLQDGRDHFISVRSKWRPTCFGRSIEELIRVPDGGIRKFVQDTGIKGTIPHEMEVHCSAPKELFKLTDTVQNVSERCVADEAMLEKLQLPRDPGWPLDRSTWAIPVSERETLEAQLVEALDTDQSLLEVLPAELPSSQKLELLSSILLLFLASLTGGLIPHHLWTKITTALPNLAHQPVATWPDTKTHILDILSSAPNHNIAFVFLTATLSRVAHELTPSTHFSPESLAEKSLIARRLSFRKGAGGAAGGGAATEEDVRKRRKAREKRFAELIGPVACRGAAGEKGVKEKERVVIEMFLRREEVPLGTTAAVHKRSGSSG